MPIRPLTKKLDDVSITNGGWVNRARELINTVLFPDLPLSPLFFLGVGVGVEVGRRGYLFETKSLYEVQATLELLV